jgi:[ribosomal protein S18]-alanine N-acetyltransferase
VKSGALNILPMMRSHIRACDAIAAVSEPWLTLNERIDFLKYIRLKQAFVCLLGDKPAGFVIFTPEPVFARGGYLRAIGVDPAMRRRGIGRMLLGFAEGMTARRSPNLYLCVSSFNRKARAFYKSLGYTRVGKLPGLIMPGASEYIFWKKLKNKSASYE